MNRFNYVSALTMMEQSIQWECLQKDHLPFLVWTLGDGSSSCWPSRFWIGLERTRDLNGLLDLFFLVIQFLKCLLKRCLTLFLGWSGTKCSKLPSQRMQQTLVRLAWDSYSKSNCKQSLKSELLAYSLDVWDCSQISIISGVLPPQSSGYLESVENVLKKVSSFWRGLLMFVICRKRLISNVSNVSNVIF